MKKECILTNFYLQSLTYFYRKKYIPLSLFVVDLVSFISNYPTNKIHNNYVFFRHFLVSNKRNYKMAFYNVISVRKSNILKYNVILTSSKNVTSTNK